MPHIVVIGAGQAGAALVARLRAQGFGGEITLIGQEAHPPYQRPPLSKGYLLGDLARERLFLHPQAWYAEQGIDLRLGVTASDIDLAARTVRAGDDVLGYDQLAIATGLVPRALGPEKGGDKDGVFTVRTLADVDALAPALRSARRMLVVGGGYIGLEAAAVARKSGLDVTIVEAQARILSRVAAPETAAYFRDLHRAQGVEVIEDASLDRLTGEAAIDGGVLADGRRIEADVCVIGIGLIPRCAIAEAAGLDVGGGVRVDPFGRTSDPAVWAAGDCAAMKIRGDYVRLESVQNAIDMAEAVAGNMLGAEAPYMPVPWFWSDQYDVKLQIVGLNTGYDRLVARPGARDGARSHWYYAGDTLLAVDAMNDARAYMVGKRMIEGGISPDPGAVADPGADLKALLTA